jgi:hypothetical protein
MIQRLHGCLPPGAKFSATDGVKRITFDFLDRSDALPYGLTFVADDALAFHYANQRPATCAATGADGRVPLFFTGYQLLLGYQQRQQLPGARSAARSQCR